MQRAVVLCPNRHIDTMHLMFDECAQAPEFTNIATSGASAAYVSSQVQQEAQMAETFTNSMVGVLHNGIVQPAGSFQADTTQNATTNLQDAVKSSEHQMILAAIQTTDSRIEAAAKLGISPRTLRYKLAKLKAENGTMAWAA